MMSDAIKTERTRITISGILPYAPYHKQVEVGGLVIPGKHGLAVTEAPNASPRRWRITHVSSGMSIGPYFHKRRNAIAAMDELYGLGVPWQLRKRHLFKKFLDRPTLAKAIAIVYQHFLARPGVEAA